LVMNKLQTRHPVYRTKLFDFGDTVDSMYFIKEGEFEIDMDLTFYDELLNKSSDEYKISKVKQQIRDGIKGSKKGEKPICKMRIGKNETFGDFELGMGFAARKCRATCVSGKGTVMQLSAKHICSTLMKDIKEFYQSKHNHIVKMFLHEKNVSKSLQDDMKILINLSRAKFANQVSGDGQNVFIKYIRIPKCDADHL
jgi:hypothetical protein